MTVDQTTDWPSPDDLALGRAAYREWVSFDPRPGDLEWEDLPDRDRDAWCHIAGTVVEHYRAMREQLTRGDDADG